MNGHLLDCNVVSELRKQSRCDQSVRAWFETQSSSGLYLSVLTLGEIRGGITRLGLRDREQASRLELWLRVLEVNYVDRILSVTSAIAKRWGRLSPHQPLPAIDGILAATALEHDLTLVTRNTKDFERSGARLINPFSS
jgi:toxin FitB